MKSDWRKIKNVAIAREHLSKMLIILIQNSNYLQSRKIEGLLLDDMANCDRQKIINLRAKPTLHFLLKEFSYLP